ncbi:MAG: hypothetical protein AB8B61_01910, partial [Cyclobacteriaceae bacterium]
KVDSILGQDSTSKVIVGGDFNDDYTSESIQYLQKENRLKPVSDSKIGTLKYKSNWNTFDQWFVSTSLANQVKTSVFKPEWLLMEDEKYHGKKPFRTYSGMNYIGGFSDHLPIMLELKLQ